MRYFKKAGPSTPIYLPKGEVVRFATLDGKTGYHATEDATHIAAFEKCIREGRGGLSTIEEAEYENEYAKKKLTSKPFVQRSERESIGGGPLQDTFNRRPAAAESAVTPEPAAPAATDWNQASVARPRVGRRPSE